MKKLLAFLLCIFFSCALWSQEKYEFKGTLQVNTSEIPYEVHILIHSDSVTAYSITWKGLKYEYITKLNIEIDTSAYPASVTIIETSNIKTSYQEPNSNFCFVRGQFRVENIGDKSKMLGKFVGYTSEQELCGEGVLKLWSDKLFPPMRPKTLIDSTPSSIKHPDTTIQSIAAGSLDTLHQGYLTSDQIYTYKTSSRSLRIQFSDFSNPDGDSIAVYLNNKKISDDVRLSKKQLLLSVPLNSTGIDTIKIRILSEGEVSPNTSQFNLYDDGKMKFYNFLINAKRENEIILLVLRE